RRDRGDGTALVVPDIQFEDRYELAIGGEKIEVLHLGPAHSPGDTQVYLPEHKAMISGDIAFNVRMPPIFEDTDTRAWLETWEIFIAMEMDTLIPGHGGPTDQATVTRFTKDYLQWIREQIGALIEEGGTMTDVYDIDQSRFADWDTFTELNKVNAQRIFGQMEFE
ncbi:MBL fold metallo-hydrolase, partial [Gammaproteobacteria bacterium]|nr:MBL fold metallo-hydrolase [Gammaproteobacteria bacterium]